VKQVGQGFGKEGEGRLSKIVCTGLNGGRKTKRYGQGERRREGIGQDVSPSENLLDEVMLVLTAKHSGFVGIAVV
jgi:hypothetical protein